MAPPNPTFPLSGRDIYSVPRSEVILAATNAPIIYVGARVEVARVHDAAVLKFGRGVRPSEGENMRLVRQSTTILLPAVIDTWRSDVQDDDVPEGYLLMEYIEGTVVENIWSTLDAPTKLSIHHQVYDGIQQLQAIQLTQPGPVGGDACRAFLFTAYGAGPFMSTEDMENWFDERLLVCKGFKQAPPNQPSFSGTFKPLVMCHLDLFARNLLLDKQQRVWILDWSFAGGYPPWFEWVTLKYYGDPSYTQGLLALMGDKYTDEVKNIRAIWYAISIAAYAKPMSSLVPK
jgi:hypothetical protein